MARNKSNKEKKTINFGVIFLMLLFVAGLTFLILALMTPSKNNNGEVLDTAVNETENKQEPQKDNIVVEGVDEDGNPNYDGGLTEKTPTQYEGTVDKTGAISANISRNEVVGDKYILRVTINELLSDGTCTLEMSTKNGDSLKRTSNVIQSGADSSSCDNFGYNGYEITTNGISSGSYSFTVTIKSGNRTGKVTGDINI